MLLVMLLGQAESGTILVVQPVSRASHISPDRKVYPSKAISNLLRLQIPRRRAAMLETSGILQHNQGHPSHLQ